MPSEQEMMADLATADAAGDSQLAEHIAGQIKALRAPPAPPKVSTPEAILGGVAQGATLGFGDEMEAGWKHLVGGADYTKTRDQLRAANANARSQHPVAYTGGEIGGSLLPSAVAALATGGTSLAPGMAKAALPLAAGQGALQGAGYSNADSAGGLARDSALGAGVGVAGYGLGQTLGAVGRKVAGSARGLAVRAEAKAADKAAKEVAEQIASAKGALGGEVQKGSRLVENLQRFGTHLGPEEQAAADDLVQRVEQSNLRSLPGQAQAIAARDAEFAAAKTGASEAFAARKADLLSTDEMKRQVLARALRYGPVALGSLAGHYVGGPIGGTVGALAGAGTRPMVRSVLRMSTNPAVQKAFGNFIADGANGPTAALLRRAIQAAPVAATQQLVTQ